MLDIQGQPVSSVGQRHGELAVRVRVNDGAETRRAGDKNRCGGQGTAIRSAERPLNGPGGQLR